MTRFQPIRSASCAVIGLLLLINVLDARPVKAQAGAVSNRRSLVTQAVNESDMVKLLGNTRPEANASNDRGPLADDFVLDHLQIQLRLPAESEQQLQQLIDSLHDPTSPNFHHWLTAEEFSQQFSLSPQDIDAVTAWLQSHGLTVNVIYPRSIDFSATAGQVRETFRTEIHKLDVNGAQHIANMSDPEIPAALAPVVVGVLALNDFMPRQMAHPRMSYTVGGGDYAVVPADLATIYNFNPLFSRGYSGQGQTVVVVEDSDVFSAADWNTFRSTFGLSTYTSGSFTQVHPAPPSGNNNCRDPGVNGDDSEAILDAEWASAAAPNAAIALASCRNTSTFGGFIALQNLLNQSGTPPAIVSISYGSAEADLGSVANAAINALYQQAVAEGVSLFVAVGDQGAAASDSDVAAATHGIGVSGFASTIYNVAMGGTDFADTFAGTNSTYWSSSNAANYGSALSYVPEIPWNDSCAGVLIASFLNFESSSGSSGLCNSSSGQNFLTTAAGSGGPSGCATGAPSTNGVVGGSCAGYAKPSWQSLTGNPSDGVRDLPDVSVFAANGIWGHYYIVCYSDLARGGASCTGSPNNWSGFGGTSFASPIMAGVQALVNQATGNRWGNPNPTYYALASAEYGSGGSAACNSTAGNNVGGACIFYDVTQGDIDVDCTGVQDCYLPSGTYGVLSTSSASFQRAYGTHTGWDFATGIGSVNVNNLVTGWPSTSLRITTGSLPDGQVGTAYSTTLAASGGTAPYSWTLTSGTLPSGLNLNSSTGVINGTPTTSANATALTFQVSDSSSPPQTGSVDLSLTIASTTLTIATTSLPNGQVGTAYSTTLAASGGTAPYSWTLTSGTLPSGLTLNSSTGVISGTPTTAVTSTALTFKVTDSSSPALTSSSGLTLTIASAALSIATVSLPNGQVGVPYSVGLTATGGVTPYSWTLLSGTLPSGLSLNSSTGVLSGTPTAAVTATALTFKVTDSSSPVQTSSVTLTLTIAPATLAITSASLPSGEVGISYAVALTATGGITPYTWALTSGVLPPGLALNSLTGTFAGTPTAAASATALTFKVTDSGSPAQSASVTLALTISSATLSIETPSLANGQVGTAYSATLAAAGGRAPYTWTISSGTLPAGLTLNSATGGISGTPTAAATATPLTFKVTDSSSPPQAASAAMTLTIVFPFTVTFSVNGLTISAPGGSSSTTLTVAAVSGYAATINLSCSVSYAGQGAPNDSPTCSLSPSQLNLSGSTVMSTLTVNTTAPSAWLVPAGKHKPEWSIPGEMALTVAITVVLALGLLCASKRRMRAFAFLLLLACVWVPIGCGAGSSTPSGGGNAGTTTGNYTVAVAATSANASTSAALPVAVQ